jgi:hypothetical protein
LLLENPDGLTRSEIMTEAKCSPSPIQTLTRLGFIRSREISLSTATGGGRCHPQWSGTPSAQWLSALWSDRQRQNGSVSQRHCSLPRTGPRRNCVGPGNLTHATNS